ncbi:Hypothetical predicted protein [Marmota monax]|uniref:Uncharacterized protein n=1 Tax=Marmota monax TaxID=9995 RepID=A0A5E4BI37_MARMO|nr:Hypothetical predicted protein [Marmota monax]
MDRVDRVVGSPDLCRKDHKGPSRFRVDLTKTLGRDVRRREVPRVSGGEKTEGRTRVWYFRSSEGVPKSLVV